MDISLKVEGMHCKSCKMLVEDELEDIGATDVQVTLDEGAQTGKVHCRHDDRKQVVRAIEELGDYKVI